ncbi:cation:proton antiporter [Wolbachia pipientis]|uniref:Cation:proton antiporter n=1 Tax=Wolbachia pipientis TaxID=955 RepID=A0A1E7QKB3_WOLPI|nr:Na+/H+ antiporter subunit E [Wolbachia pipientis]OEY86908.1 cation:proton antiporter [Wolbachia pipientis]
MQSLYCRQAIKSFFTFFIVLLILWNVLSGYFDSFFVASGLFSSIFTLFVFKRLVDAERSLHNIISNKLSLYSLFVSYIPWLMCQIILSSIYVTKKTLQFDLKLTPVILLRKSKKHHDKSAALFANSVTITPGTLTINVENRRKTYLFTICLIDKDLEKGISAMESKVLSHRLQ